MGLKPMDIIMAIIAAVLIGYAVGTSTEAAWAGPVAGIVALVALIGINRFKRGGRRAR